MSLKLLSLAYVSSATRPFTVDELNSLLVYARDRNREDGISGVLLYSDGNFMQVLEGPPDVVQSTYQRVCSSNHHAGIIELYREEIDERDFPDWSMGFRQLDPASYAPLRERLAAGISPAHTVLRSFLQ